jgi:hypothetical protein
LSLGRRYCRIGRRRSGARCVELLLGDDLLRCEIGHTLEIGSCARGIRSRRSDLRLKCCALSSRSLYLSLGLTVSASRRLCRSKVGICLRKSHRELRGVELHNYLTRGYMIVLADSDARHVAANLRDNGNDVSVN